MTIVNGLYDMDFRDFDGEIATKAILNGVAVLMKTEILTRLMEIF